MEILPTSYLTSSLLLLSAIYIKITGLKQFGMLENIIAVTEENTTIRRKMHEEAMARQDKLLDILGKIPSSNSNSSHPENSADNERSSPSKTELHSRCKYHS